MIPLTQLPVNFSRAVQAKAEERELTWPVIDPSLIPEKPSVIAARRLGYEPFEYGERS